MYVSLLQARRINFDAPGGYPLEVVCQSFGLKQENMTSKNIEIMLIHFFDILYSSDTRSAYHPGAAGCHGAAVLKACTEMRHVGS